MSMWKIGLTLTAPGLDLLGPDGSVLVSKETVCRPLARIAF